MKPMTRAATRDYVAAVPAWDLAKNAKKITREFLFADFKGALKFVNSVGKVAEREGHHPDIAIHYNQVILDLWTHSIGGLSVDRKSVV